MVIVLSVTDKKLVFNWQYRNGDYIFLHIFSLKIELYFI